MKTKLSDLKILVGFFLFFLVFFGFVFLFFLGGGVISFIYYVNLINYFSCAPANQLWRFPETSPRLPPGFTPVPGERVRQPVLGSGV